MIDRLISLKSFLLFHFRLSILTATELYRNDTTIQMAISKSREQLENYPNQSKVVLKSMPQKMEIVERELAEQNSNKYQSSTKN